MVITENNFRWIKVIKAKENLGYLDNWGLKICMAREETQFKIVLRGQRPHKEKVLVRPAKTNICSIVW